ncbi:MAG: STM4011 family radical SAM protein [Lachnospiraceae bacterium]|nr:STM4011 family radical SAM protein [Lachnospiraceae bacterium]
MDKHMILYRGSLKSCNYHCSYCPFSKHPMSERELDRDQMQWCSFVKRLLKKAKALHIGALMVVPYGEAMIHHWYWDGLAQLSAFAEIDAVGIQTNLSFSVSEFLSSYEKAGGMPEKLRLWATFHPEMTTVSEFCAKCRQLREQDIQLCAGSVGVPENLHLLQELKQELKGIYLWVNKMDGLRRSYTQKEREAFEEIDPYFARELMKVPGNVSMCRGRLFVEADGGLRSCNIGSTLKENWDTLDDFPIPECSRKQCSCYLAYGGRGDFMNQVLFGPYPLFRIPRCPRAVFLDIEGTLFSSKDNCGESHTVDVSSNIMGELEILAKQKVYLFFATTMPYREAMQRCRKIRHLFAGGIFAGGAHIVWGQEREYYYELEDSWLTDLAVLKKELRFRILTYRNCGKLYKVTLIRSVHSPWTLQEAAAIMSHVSDVKSMRCYIEENCLQIVSADASKARGVEMLCRWMDISPKDAAAVGDSKEDEEMMELCNS